MVMISIDILIDLYVTVRLIQVLRSANRNVAGLRANMSRKTKRTLFTAVMYWNFVRLGVAFGLNVTTLASNLTGKLHANYDLDQIATRNFFQTFFFIVMSYVVTVDAEIVKVIEGEDQNKKGTSKSSSGKTNYQSSSTNMTSKSTGSISLPKYNTPNSPTIFERTSRNDTETYDVSMKRLSFFEWANIVLGFRREGNHVQEFTQEELEEIVEGPSDTTNNDLEKGEATNRVSNISGKSTIIANLNDKPDT